MNVRKASVRLAVAASALALVAAGCGDDTDDTGSSGNGGGGEQRHSVIMALQTGIPPTVPIQVGLDEGIFDRHGVDLELIPQPSGVVAQTLLLSDSANFSVLAPSSIGTSFQQGEEFSYACGAQLFNPVSLVAPADSDLPVSEDGSDWKEVLRALKGKTVGLPLPLGSGSSNLFVATLAEAGLGPDDVTIINTGSGPTLLGAIEGKQVDAAVALSPGTERLTTGSNPVAKELIYMPDGPESYRDYGTGWVASTKWLEEHEDAAKAFCDAMRDVEEFIGDEANEDAFGKAIVKAAGELEGDQLSAVADRLRPLFVTEIPQDALDAAVQRAVSQGVLEEDPVPTYADMVFAGSAG